MLQYHYNNPHGVRGYGAANGCYFIISQSVCFIIKMFRHVRCENYERKKKLNPSGDRHTFRPPTLMVLILFCNAIKWKALVLMNIFRFFHIVQHFFWFSNQSFVLRVRSWRSHITSKVTNYPLPPRPHGTDERHIVYGHRGLKKKIRFSY